MRFGTIPSQGFLRIGRYIGETCNAKDGLVKVLLERVRDGTVPIPWAGGVWRTKKLFRSCAIESPQTTAKSAKFLNSGGSSRHPGPA